MFESITVYAIHIHTRYASPSNPFDVVLPHMPGGALSRDYFTHFSLLRMSSQSVSIDRDYLIHFDLQEKQGS